MQKKQNNLLKHQSIQDLIDEQIHREGGLKAKPVKPLGTPVLAQPHTAIYKMHRYWARRPHNVFAHIIQHYTNPGDLVLDPFCGGGVTVVESVRLRRRVVGIDINPLATWITQVEVEPVDLEELEKAFNDWYKWCVEQVSPLFKTECAKCGNKNAQAEWYEWSNVVVCPNCGREVVLAEAEKGKNAIYLCPHKGCSCKFQPSGLERRPDKMMLVKTICKKCDETDIRKPRKSDLRLAEEIERDEKKTVKKENLFIPDDKFPDMNYVRENDLFTKGFRHFRDYFTPRQRVSLSRIRKWLEDGKEGKSRNELLHLFSINLRYTNKMVFRSEGWQNSQPIEWAGHIYWPPYVYVELNALEGLRKKAASIKRGKNLINEEIDGFFSFPQNKRFKDALSPDSTYWLLTRSAERISLQDKSVDAIITDPPFGGNVQYLELSDFYLVWLKDLKPWAGITNKSREAIQTRHQGFDGAKDINHYERVLYNIFRECRRVLKPEGYMVMTFHNKEIAVWMALHRAAQRAGFKMPPHGEARDRGMIYQPAVENYKQTLHLKRSGSLLGDFILTFKPVDQPLELAAVQQELTSAEEKTLHQKAEEIIRYHGGVEERDLWTGLMPYLSDTGILARVAKFSIKALLSTGPFEYLKKDKKWYMKDMLENGSLSALQFIQAEFATQQLVYSYLSEKKSATLDDLLKVIYTNLVNSQLPQMASIEKVLTRYCRKVRKKGEKRDVYVWSPGKLTPLEAERVKQLQASLPFDTPITADHNGIIIVLARQAIERDYDVHVGRTEQRKSPILKNLSSPLTGFELGLSPATFDLIKEIDLLILKNNNIQAAVEVVITLSTFNKAINDRFRNLLQVAPNLNIPLTAIVRDEDFDAAEKELRTPANKSAGLTERVRVIRLSNMSGTELITALL